MAARRLHPYRQGRLDGLCGVYALINALRLLCPRLDEDACEARLLRPDPSPSPAGRFPVGGHLRRAVSAGAAAADRPVAAVRGQEFGVTLSVSRLKVSEPSLRGLWRGLCRALDGQSVAIVGLDGIERHWTVGYAITERTLRVADSCGLRVIFRSQCTVGRRACAISSVPPRCWLSGGCARDSESHNSRAEQHHDGRHQTRGRTFSPLQRGLRYLGPWVPSRALSPP